MQMPPFPGALPPFLVDPQAAALAAAAAHKPHKPVASKPDGEQLLARAAGALLSDPLGHAFHPVAPSTSNAGGAAPLGGGRPDAFTMPAPAWQHDDGPEQQHWQKRLRVDSGSLGSTAAAIVALTAAVAGSNGGMNQPAPALGQGQGAADWLGMGSGAQQLQAAQQQLQAAVHSMGSQPYGNVWGTYAGLGGSLGGNVGLGSNIGGSYSGSLGGVGAGWPRFPQPAQQPIDPAAAAAEAAGVLAAAARGILPPSGAPPRQ